MLSSEHDALVLLYDEAENIFIELARPGLVEHASRHITGGDDEIDGDKLDVDWDPSNYTPTTSPSEVDSTDNLTAHLAGIDAALNPSNVLTVLDGSTLAISDGILTPTGSYHTVEAEVGSADNLDYVMDGEEGNLLFLRPASGHTITVRDNEGDLRLHDGNFVMADEDEFILLCWVDELGEWVEVARSSTPLNPLTVFNGSTVAISGGVLTPTGSYHTVAAESGAADNLDYIMDGVEGNLLFLRPASGDTITVRDNEGDLRLHDGNFVMGSEDEFILLCWVDELSEWVEVARSTRPLTVDGVFNFTGTMGNSTKDPTADAPADWVEVEIGGTTYYLPAYTAS